MVTTRPEHEAAQDEYESFLAQSGLSREDLQHIALEEVDFLDSFTAADVSGVLIGASPYNADTPAAEKTRSQLNVEEQIRELLRQLDAGEQPEGTHPGRMRVIDESTPRPQPGTRLKLAEVSGLTGVPVADIESMVAAGILSTDARGRLTSQAPDIVRFASMLTAAGFDLRQVRSIRTSAHAHAVLVSNSLAGERARRSSAAGERAIATATENSAVIAQLYRALLTENIEVELR